MGITLQMVKKYVLLVNILQLLTLSLGKRHLVRTSEGNFLVETEKKPRAHHKEHGSKRNFLLKNKKKIGDRHREHGSDYQEDYWLDRCSLKSSAATKGKRTTLTVAGCQEIHMQCDGGCLKIIQAQYSCAQQQINSVYDELIRKNCAKKKTCTATSPGATLKSQPSCQGVTSQQKILKLTYRCDGGTDKTTNTNCDEIEEPKTTEKPGLTWRKIYSHDITGGLFADLEEAKKKNVDDEDAKLFSRLYDLESMKDDQGVFHFKLCYPERVDVDINCNEWKQSSNPVTESKVTDFQGIRLTWPLRSDLKPFGGLMKSTPDKNLMDDFDGPDPTGTRWWNSVGTLKSYKNTGKIPGPVDKSKKPILVEKKDLYVYTKYPGPEDKDGRGSEDTGTDKETGTGDGTKTGDSTGPGDGTDGKAWTKVFAHDISGGPFADLEEATRKNIDDEDAKLFSKLYDLESLRNNEGVFHFKLCYPEGSEVTFKCNEWKQSSNPVTDSKVTDFEAIHLTWPLKADHQPFSGLMRSTPEKNLIDDTEGTKDDNAGLLWTNSIGTIEPLEGKIPGPVDKDGKEILIRKNVLYVNTD